MNEYKITYSDKSVDYTYASCLADAACNVHRMQKFHNMYNGHVCKRIISIVEIDFSEVL